MYLDNLKKRIKTATKSYQNGVARELRDAVQQEVPVLSGLLRSSVQIDSDGEDKLIGPDAGTLRREAGVDYAPFVYFGTRPHIIEAKNAKVLSDGNTIFGPRVNHPGTRSNKFINRAVDRKVGNFKSKFKL